MVGLCWSAVEQYRITLVILSGDIDQISREKEKLNMWLQAFKFKHVFHEDYSKHW